MRTKLQVFSISNWLDRYLTLPWAVGVGATNEVPMEAQSEASHWDHNGASHQDHNEASHQDHNEASHSDHSGPPSRVRLFLLHNSARQ
jgi:hypothetical protein